MPPVSAKQQRFMGAELQRKREGKRTRTGMSEAQLREFASNPGPNPGKGNPVDTEMSYGKGDGKGMMKGDKGMSSTTPKDKTMSHGMPQTTSSSQPKGDYYSKRRRQGW